MVPKGSHSSQGTGPPADAGATFVSLEKDILDHLAKAARTLAIKGFSPDEATSGNGACGLTVRGKSTGIEGRIVFKPGRPGEREIGWDYAITSSLMPDKSENGVAGDDAQVKHVVEAFVSVFTTVASFVAA